MGTLHHGIVSYVVSLCCCATVQLESVQIAVFVFLFRSVASYCWCSLLFLCLLSGVVLVCVLCCLSFIVVDWLWFISRFLSSAVAVVVTTVVAVERRWCSVLCFLWLVS